MTFSSPNNKHKMKVQILLLLGFFLLFYSFYRENSGLTTAIPTTERFYKYLMRVYQIIEKNREWYEDLLNNKISDQQFTVSSCTVLYFW